MQYQVLRHPPQNFSRFRVGTSLYRTTTHKMAVLATTSTVDSVKLLTCNEYYMCYDSNSGLLDKTHASYLGAYSLTAQFSFKSLA